MEIAQNRLARLLGSFFYIGFFPVAPGTLASFAGMLICFSLYPYPLFYTALFVVITTAGLAASTRIERVTGLKDPSFIVIDEVAGVMIAFFLLPLNPAVAWTTFFLFRAFDMFKIFPANRFEKMKGGVGVMMDDIIAGIYTNLVMQVAVRIVQVIGHGF